MTLSELKQALIDLDADVPVFHYFASPKTACPYLVFHEQPTEDWSADDIHAEMTWRVEISFYTKDEFPSYVKKLVQLFQGSSEAWSYDEVYLMTDEDVIRHTFTVYAAWDYEEPDNG